MLGRVLTRIFALFGMTLTCVACYGVEYAEYKQDFVASGRVVDQDQNPIIGIQVRMMGGTGYSGTNGRFFVRGASLGTVTFTDVDGEENGGKFEERSITVDGSEDYVDLGVVELRRENEQ